MNLQKYDMPRAGLCATGEAGMIQRGMGRQITIILAKVLQPSQGLLNSESHMNTFKGKVAVITGGASGIGRALAERCMEEGVQLALADVEQSALNRVEKELRDAGADVLAVRTDVSKADEVAALAQRTLERFGAVHLLFNNAGVGGAGPTIWQATLADWDWTLGVNLWASCMASARLCR